MRTEVVLAVTLLCLALLPILGVWGRVAVKSSLIRTALVALWLILPTALIGTAISFSTPVVPPFEPANRPVEVRFDGYLGSAACVRCHPHEHGTWYRSYHRTMTQVATPETVLAPFDNVPLEDGISFRAIRRGDQFSVLLPEPYEERPVVMTTGSHHMQVYWFAAHDDSRILGLVPFAYLKEEGRWLPRRSMFLQPPEQPETLELGHWNSTCIECHATNGKMLPTINEDGNWWTDQVNTQVAELGIACEACHGPGAEHVKANRDPARRYARHLTDQADDTIVNPSRLPHDLSSQVCGQCHGLMAVAEWRKWALEGGDFLPGQDLNQADTRFIVKFGEQQRAEITQLEQEQPDYFEQNFWPDGMIRIAGREYSGLVESPCFKNGEMSCLSCHRMHQASDDPRETAEWANDQLELAMDGDQACLQCHQEYESAERIAAHTHHSVSSSGSKCYNCHMPYTTYGLLKAIRSHQVDTPSVATSLTTGRPNACNQCHLDQTLAWTAEKMLEWYDTEPPELTDDQRSIAASVLWLLSGDAAQRALMAWSFGWEDAQRVSETAWMPPYLIQLLEDPYDAVRLIASRSLRSLDGFEEFGYEWPVTAQRQLEVRQRGMDLWQDRRKSMQSGVLIGDDGKLMEDEFFRLLGRRNDRAVRVAE
jgi:hypothetical protein